MGNAIKLISLANTLVERFGPKAAAIGILLVAVGQVLQGKFEEIDSNLAIEALIALGLWGSRANKKTSEQVGAK